MKILAIRGKNLASIEGVFELNFTRDPLLSAGIFAITGPTGAGKSTLLDAMCLALFAQFPRLLTAQERNIELKDGAKSSINQGDPRSVLRKGTADGYAEVDFKGQDGKPYRSRWSVRRSYNKVGEGLQKDTITLYSLPSEEIIGEKKTETLEKIRELIGLNFEQFRRSVLLAQNDFTAFLKADKHEKAALLEKLTGTDIYSKISIAVYENWKKNNDELLIEKKQLEGVELFDQSHIDNLISSIEHLKCNLTQMDDKIKFLDNGIKWYNDLTILEQEEKSALQKLTEVQHNLNQLADKQQLITQIEQLQPVRSVYEKKNIHTQSLENQYLLLNENVENEKNLIDSLENAVLTENTEKEKLSKLRLEQEKMIPKLEHAKKLIILLDEKEKQLNSVMQDLENAKKKTAENRLKKDNNEKTILHSNKEIQDITHWMQTYQDKRVIAENVSLIQHKLSNAEANFQKEQVLEKKVHDSNKECHNLKLIVDNLKQEVEKIQLQISQQVQQLTTLKNQQESIDIQMLIEKKKIYMARQEHLFSAEQIWSEFSSFNAERDTRQTTLISLQTELENNRNELAGIVEEMQFAEVELLQSEKMLEKAKMAVFENVQNMRENLTENEPCPVCGSTEHPYLKEDLNLQHVFEELNKETKKCKNNYEQLLKKHATLLQIIKTHEKRVEDIKEKIVYLNEHLSLLNEQKREHILYDELQKSDEKNSILWIEKEKNTISSMLKNLYEQEKVYHEVTNLIGKEQKKSDILSNDQQKKEKELEKKNRECDTKLHQYTTFVNEKNELSVTINELIKDLNNYFSDDKWIDNWKRSPILFLENVTDFAKLWKDKQEQFNNAQQNLKTANSLSDFLQEQFENTLKEESEIEKHIHSIQIEIEKLKKDIADLLQGKTVEYFESFFKNEIDLIQISIKTIEKKVAGFQEELKGTSEKKQLIDNAIRELTNQIQLCENALNDFISAYNTQHSKELTREILSELFDYPLEWITQQQNKLKQVREELIQATSTYDERSSRRQKHIEKQQSETALNELLEAKEAQILLISEKKKELQEFEFQLRRNEENQKRYNSILKKIEKKTLEVDNWARLNMLIGSADGKKFRQIAQEYTLDVLLTYANVHLMDLARRYSIERVPETLALQVVDKDMGNEIRSVHSLSGGESFLVSLALALGLASLSSNRMNIESLFIDEGFGSLDPDTLNIAMNALDRLQTQGRKIGVISHVQEMTERIPVQVKVEKISAGTSSVCIV